MLGMTTLIVVFPKETKEKNQSVSNLYFYIKYTILEICQTLISKIIYP